MQKNSILFLTNAYPDFESSYHGIFIKKMAVLLKDEGYKISVVTPKIYKGSLYFENQNGIKVYRFPFFSGNRLLIEYESVPYLKMVLYYITGFFLTLYVFIKHQCQLIHVHWAIPTGLIGVFIGALLRRPLFVTVHGSDFRMAMVGSALLKGIFLYVCKKAKHITCVSEVQKREIEKLGIKGEKISIFPMGVDQAFLEAGRKRENKLNNRPFKIFSNRNLLPIYNVSLLIRAIPMVIKEEPKVRFLIAGDGPERKNLEKEAMDLNVNKSVQFLGRIPHEEMSNLLAEADIYISTSLHDGTSVSLLEAMAAGAFPIVTNISSNLEWITDNKNGFLFPIDDEGFLAKRIIDAIGNQALLKESRVKNINIIEENALWSENIKRVKEIYMDLLDSKIWKMA